MTEENELPDCHEGPDEHMGPVLKARALLKPAQTKQPEATMKVCSLCGGGAYWADDQQVWRHTANLPHSTEFIICPRYGYPIQVVDVSAETGAASKGE